MFMLKLMHDIIVQANSVPSCGQTLHVLNKVLFTKRGGRGKAEEGG